jgi:hypothetical protein
MEHLDDGFAAAESSGPPSVEFHESNVIRAARKSMIRSDVRINGIFLMKASRSALWTLRLAPRVKNDYARYGGYRFRILPE